MNINEILKGISCACGKDHTCDIKHVYIEKGAMAHLPVILAPYKKVLLVADENTYAAAGDRVEQALGKHICARQIFSGASVLVPNEAAIEAVTAKCFGCDFILGIGSGVIQDLCKYVSFERNLPYAIVATAPSMDGYASSGAAMITDGMKVTYSAGVPFAILADPDVLKKAPLEMIQAGYGDIIGKYSALNDWKLAHTVNGEYFCDYIYDLTFEMLKKTLPLAEKLLARDEESIRILMEALIVVGIAMSFAGNSRPASGSEHHLSHYFEITGIVEGSDYLAHGIDVFYSTYVTAKIREFLASHPFPAQKFVMDEGLYRKEMARVYREVADGCVALQKKLDTYGRDLVPVYLEKEAELKKILSEVPSASEIEGMIRSIGLDLKSFYSIYSHEKIADAVRYAKDLKDRYTVLWMYYDLYGTKEVI